MEFWKLSTLGAGYRFLKIARPNTDGDELRSFAKNIGSNFFLKDKQLQIEYKKPFASLRAAALARASVPAHLENSLIVNYYNEIRTYFSTNY